MNTKTNSRKWSSIPLNERRAAATGMLLLLLLPTLPAVLQAQSYTNIYGIWSYATRNGTITMTGYTGTNGAVTIPDRIPDTTNGLPVTSIGDSAFYWCTSLTSVTIGTNVTSIGTNAFLDCYSLTSVSIPNSVTSIGDDAFCGCSILTSITIPNSVTSVGDYAFCGCSILTSITIPNSVTSIGVGAFSYCFSLTAITVDTRNAVYSDVDGVLFNRSLTTLVEYPGGIAGSYTIPNSVISIGDDAFYGCESLTSVTIGTNVTNIGDWAFYGCSSLTNVCFEGNAPSFGQSVFFNSGPLSWPAWDPATIYYLPGTTGWDDVSTTTDLPTGLWLPQVETSDASFGVRANQFGFNINWASGMTVVVEACTNLANPTWYPLATNTLTSGSTYFSDPQWTNHTRRFYRLRSQ